MTEQAQRESAYAILRKQFPPEQIGKLPRGPVQLDYVGHADVTSRLLEADPEWNWEPKAKDVDPEVMTAALATGDKNIVQQVLDNAPPKFDLDRNGNPVGLWIRLTVAGVTRPGYGSCPSSQHDAVKVLIGDALRNAAMRFGVALDLWAKGDRQDPTAENATASAGQARRRPQSAGDAWNDAPPANGNGHSRTVGQTVRPAANGASTELPGPREPDPDAQPYADEAHEARTLAELKAINARAREAHKLASLITNPGTKGTGGLGQFIGWRRKQLEEVESALRELNEAANAARIDPVELDVQVKKVTGSDIEGATAAQLRQAAEAMKSQAAA